MTYLYQRLINRNLTGNCCRISQRMAHTYDGADENKDDEINVGKFGSFTIFRINRPEKRNCLNYSSAVKLKEALRKFNNDPLSPVGIICGEGGNFCSGLDCNELASDSKFYENFLDLGLMEEFSRKPIIAAVNGYAVGTGFDLALWCDLRVVEDNAVFGYINNRLGVPVSESSTKRLLQLVGRARAVDWILTGRNVYAKEAFQAGIVSRLVACGTAYGQSVNLAISVGKYPYVCTLLNRINLYMDSFPPEEQEKMLNEKYNLLSVLNENIASGSKKFVGGFGRHGKSTGVK